MKLEHVAVWTHRLEELKNFYVAFFDGVANEKYVSDKGFKGMFASYFLTFDGGARLELMQLNGVPQGDNADGFESTGFTHIAFSVDTPSDLDRLYARMKDAGAPVVGAPRWTGDGYYEACVLDPDGNRVEIAATP